MRSKEHSKLSNEFQRMILDFWIEKDVRPEWIMRILIETAATYVPKVDEYFENRTDYEKAEAFDEIKSIHLNMFGDTVRPITMEEAENFGMSVMRVLKIGEDE